MPVCKHLFPLGVCPECRVEKTFKGSIVYRLPVYLLLALLYAGCVLMRWPKRQVEFPTVRIVPLTNHVYRDLRGTNTIFYVPATVSQIAFNSLTVWQSEGFAAAPLYIASTNIKVYANSIAVLPLER